MTISTKFKTNKKNPNKNSIINSNNKAVPLTGLSYFTPVEIDPSGRFTYLQIELGLKDKKLGDQKKLLIRGSKRNKTPKALLYDFIEDELSKSDIKDKLSYRVLGGGIIDIDREKEHLKVFGDAKSYGVANHDLTKKLIQAQGGAAFRGLKIEANQDIPARAAADEGEEFIEGY